MKPTAFACICTLLCVAQAGLAQPYSQPRMAVVVSPALLVPVTVAVQVGVQARINKRCAVLVEAALPTFQPQGSDYETLHSLRTGFEFKYFIKEKSGASNYLALQSSYLFRQLASRGSKNYYTRTQTFVYTDADIQSPVLALAVKWGTEIAAGKRIYVDAFAGGGLRMIFTQYDTKTALVTSLEPPRPKLYDYDAAWQYNYTLTRLHLTAGLRFGLRL